MAVECTLVLIKPGGVQRALVGEILARFERKGLRLRGLRFVAVDDQIARAHYAVHASQPFFDALIKSICASPVVAIALEGDSAISVVRSLVGPTDCRKASPGTIRGDYGLSTSLNLVHASDSLENAASEIKLWFPNGLVPFQRCAQPWIEDLTV
jgi:nucleoside-diphosphate kinase